MRRYTQHERSRYIRINFNNCNLHYNIQGMEVKQKMNKWIQLILSIVAVTIFIVFITGCAEFQTKLEQQQRVLGVPDQLTCSPSTSTGCIGFKVEEVF